MAIDPQSLAAPSPRAALLAMLLAAATTMLAACGTTGQSSQWQHFGQERVLSDALVAKVREGMTRDEVRAALGTPARIGVDRFSKQEEWMWRYTHNHYVDMCFYARFSTEGRVSGTSTMVEKSSADFIKLC